ncbi:MAG: hypothetical protein ACUVQQ_05610 [Thermogutta sp.]
MDRRNTLLRTVLRLIGVGLVGATVFARSAATEKPDWLADAEKRIEASRKGDFEVTVLDAEGRPVAGAKVVSEQVRHDFLFGCNVFQWGRIADSELQEAYLRRFAELLNYATAPFYLLAQLRTRAGETEPRLHRKVGAVVQGTRDRSEGPSLGVELRRSSLVAGRSANGLSLAA